MAWDSTTDFDSWKRNWEKTLINTAWALTSQTHAYQQDLETTPETTCLRFEHRKRNWEKPLSILDGP